MTAVRQTEVAVMAALRSALVDPRLRRDGKRENLFISAPVKYIS